MTPVGGGISFIFSIVVIFCAWFYKKLKGLLGRSAVRDYRGIVYNPVLSILTGFFVFGAVGAIFFGYGYLLNEAGKKDSNLALIQTALYRCGPSESAIGEKNVILRLDDVQSFGWTDISIQMMQDAIKMDMPVVAGVIPKDITDDWRIVRFLKKEHCNVEIAMHGYTHGIGDDGALLGEFAVLDSAHALENVRAAKKELAKITRDDVTTFIPPQNQLSPAAKEIMADEGINIVSSRGIGFFDYDASTWDFSNNSLIGAGTVITDCERAFESGKPVCVIMLHPQDFSDSDAQINRASYREYEKILAYLKENNISVVRFSDFTRETFELFPRTLSYGDSGSDVSMLQSLLIKENSGPAALRLAQAGTTGQFGVLTRAALLEFQILNSASLFATGSFDRDTRYFFEEERIPEMWLK